MNQWTGKLSWPLEQLPDAIDALRRAAPLSSRPGAISPPSATLADDPESLDRWVQSAADALGIEAEPVEAPIHEIDALIAGAAPALLTIPTEQGPRFLVLLPGHRGSLSVLGPGAETRNMSAETIARELKRPIQELHGAPIDRLLSEAGVSMRRRAAARDALLGELLGSVRFGACWIFRASPGTSFIHQLRIAKIPRALGWLAGAHALQHTLGLAGWWIIGRGALQGRLDPGWLIAWALIMLTLVPLRLFTVSIQARLAYGTGALLKQRLLLGALRIDPQQIRHLGAGQLLGRVIESEAVESLAVSGAFMGVMALIEVAAALLVLSAGTSGLFLAGLFAAWFALVLLCCWRFFQLRRRWTGNRLNLTHLLTERMIGHRTRLAQESPDHWHDGEDEQLQDYVTSSRRLDALTVSVMSLLTRGWLLVALAALAPALFWGEPSTARLAVAFGGILLASRAIAHFTGSLSFLSDAAISWEQVAPLFHAAAHANHPARPEFLFNQDAAERQPHHGRPLVEGHDLAFRYRDEGENVLQGCSFQIGRGDRLLLEGPSGGGKSTLASLIGGLRNPRSGILLLRGLDLQTCGAQVWRRRVATAPQFHENHVVTGTLAFNLLMGRRWPAHAGDFEVAHNLCRELGLGPLLERMPAGLQQMVGETGWQLSHGERSRLFIARALLQRSELIILDESFAALDPETMRRCLECVLRHAPTLLVIAHP